MMGPDSMGGSGMWIIFPIIMIPVMLTFMYMMFVRGGHGPPWQGPRDGRNESIESESAMEILERRYVNGEITREKFDQMSEDLSSRQLERQATE